MTDIKEIQFPNNVIDSEKSFYTVWRNCDKIDRTTKNWEMALVEWFNIIRDWKIIAEIKWSICNIHY